MYRALSQVGMYIDHTPLFSFLLIAETGQADFSKIKMKYEDRELEQPNVVVFLDQAKLVARTNDLFSSGGGLHFAESGPDIYVYEPPDSVTEFRSGWLLMWLFHAFLYHLQKHGPGRGVAPIFADAILRKYPLFKSIKL